MDVGKRMIVVGAILLIVMAPTSFFSLPVSAEELRHPYPVRVMSMTPLVTLSQKG
ncbi:MAG: hypothetical protein MW690_000432 [Methanophagales archaeon]|nr:hypothetical protein [Methanophagales archaeon]